MKAKLSVLIPAFHGYHSVAAALDAWEAQTCRDQLEILIMCPEDAGSAPVEPGSLPPGQIIVPTGSALLHEARAIAIQRAAADYIMLAEDHCLPDPDWAAAMLQRMAEGWDVICPALRPGNRHSCWSEGSFLIGYGEWMIPVEGGPVDVVCGWNVVVRTQLLRDSGPALVRELMVGAFLVRRLHSQGCRFYLENRACMQHFDPTGPLRAPMFWVLGVGFGHIRAAHWPFAARLLYFLAAPAVALLHWKRAFVHYRRAGPASGVRPSALATATVLAVMWGLGESAGVFLSSARIASMLWREEIKPVSAEEVAQARTLERLA